MQPENLSKMNEADGRRGWAAACLHLERRDYATTKEFDDDISTLLIVAGLFSTVLTAFIVESYQWLQEDYTQTTAQLLMIAVKAPQSPLSNTSTFVKTPLTPLTPFTPTTSAVAINMLWFLSLVLSLASVLLGMMVKQWMREYQIPESKSPEHVIWLRQIRYRALEQWKVPIIVVSLSTLLELALILFMAGLILLLWTLHIALAIVISATISILFVVALAATCMPAIFPTCPYKSPTAWCCVQLWDALARGLCRVLWTTGHIDKRSYLSRLILHGRAKGWKDRDMRTNLHHELQTRWGAESSIDEDLKTEALKLGHLADAVAWVRGKTQNDQMCSDVCLDTSISDTRSNIRVRLLAPIYASCRDKTLDPSRFMRKHWYRHLPGHGQHGAFVLLPTTSFDAWNPWQVSEGIRVLDILSTILLRRLETVVANMLRASAGAHQQDTEVMHAFIGALCFLYQAARTTPGSALANEFAGFLVSLYNKLSSNRQLYDELYPSIRTFCVQIIQQMGSFKFVELDILVDLEHPAMTFAHYARAALNVYLNTRSQMSREDWHLFITLADLALGMCTSQNPCTHELHEMEALLQCMDEGLQTALRSPVRHCGYYDQLPWISTLATRPTTLFKSMPRSLPLNLQKIDQFSSRPAARDTLEEVQERWNRMAKRNRRPTADTPATSAAASAIAEVANTDTTVLDEDGCILEGAVGTVPSDATTSPQATSPQDSVTTQSTSRTSIGYAMSSATSEDDVSGVDERQPCAMEVDTASCTGPCPTSATQTCATLPRDVALGESRLPTGSVRGHSSGLYHVVPTEDDDDDYSKPS